MTASRTIARGAALLALLAAVVALAALLFGGGNSYVVRARFADVGGLITGFKVRIDGAAVGTVANMQLTGGDRVLVTMDLDPSAGPIGQNARATVRAADLLGEQYVDLQRGDTSHPAASGYTIPLNHTGQAVELDDVLNSLDPSTTAELRVFLNENGKAFADGGTSLADTLAVLPPSLEQTQQLLSQLGQNDAALGQLVHDSDRVVSAVAAQRVPLQQLVGSAGGTLHTLADSRSQLGQTLAQAPGTLSALRGALSALQNAAVPLGPAATGLAATAPRLNATLRQLPSFAAAAMPTLSTIRQIAPALRQLGAGGTPVVRRLAPLTTTLNSFGQSLSPVTQTLDTGIDNVLGMMEGWARATQGRDSAGHLFRFGLTISPATFSSLAPLLNASVRRPAAHPTTARPAPATTTKQPAPASHGLAGTVNSLLGGVTATAANLSATLAQTLKPVAKTLQQTSNGLKGLLNYLLK